MLVVCRTVKYESPHLRAIDQAVPPLSALDSVVLHSDHPGGALLQAYMLDIYLLFPQPLLVGAIAPLSAGSNLCV